MNYRLVLLSVFIISCHDPNRVRCDHFKTGTFRYKSQQTKNYYIIERNDSLQTELSENGNTGTFMINWTSPCEYTLNYKEQLVKTGDSVKIIFPVLNITIIKTTPEYYVFNCKAPRSAFEYDDTIWQVK